MSKSLPYRKDIDGLRAVAVLMVLFFHAEFPWVKGGFVGVDVFFVLTGFLMTSILLRDIQQNTFSLGGFYLRRIKRLQPAFLLVLLSTVTVAFLLLIPDDLISFLDSCRYALFSMGNFFFLENTGGYFDADISELPLLHTWSLAVEEQFYLIWPIFLLGAHRFLKTRLIAPVIVILIIGGLAFSQWLAHQYPNVAYLMLPGRAFEILIGTYVALQREKKTDYSCAKNNILSVVGFLLIIIPVFLLNRDSVFPGFNAAWPCLGTALLLVSGNKRHTQGIVNRMLSVSPLVWIGLLSYSIYLWHWPIIAFLNYRGEDLVGLTLLFVLVAPILLACFSFFLVERPIRYSAYRLKLWPAVAIFLILPIVSGCVIYSMADRKNGFPQRFPGKTDELNRAEATQSAGACVQDRSMKSMPYCIVGVDTSRIDGLLIGDSYAGMYIGFVDVLAKDAGLSFRHRWSGLSPPIPGISIDSNGRLWQLKYMNDRFAEVEKYNIVILVSSWGGYGRDDNKNRILDAQNNDISLQADSLQMASIDALVRQGIKVILIDRPLTPPGRKMMKRLRAAKAAGAAMADYQLPVKARAKDYFLNQVRDLYPDVLIIQPSDAICDEHMCDVAIDDTILYRSDGSHMNSQGSVLLGKQYLNKFPNPFKKISNVHGTEKIQR